MNVFNEPWTAEELAEMEVNYKRTGAAAMATAVKIDGFPTIHEIAKLGETHHRGFGFFETFGPNWTLRWCGGGAMDRTASGKAYTPVMLEGTGNPFEEKVSCSDSADPS